MLDDLIKTKDKLAEEHGFKKERIEIFHEEDGRYGIDIDGIPWSNYLTATEVDNQIYCLFMGMELAGMKGE